jgi:hypothetical protein
MDHATNTTGTVTLQLAGMDRRGAPHFLDGQGQRWHSGKAEYSEMCKWCRDKLPLHSDLVVTPENAKGVMHVVCLKHVRIRTGEDTTIPAADWFAQQPRRGPKVLHYDGGWPKVATWEELQDWKYDIDERRLRLDARKQELQVREEEGTATREEIGVAIAAERALQKELLAMSAIWQATMKSMLSKFRSEHETLERV